MDSQLVGKNILFGSTFDRKGIVRHVSYAIAITDGCVDERMSLVIETEDGRFLRCRTDQIKAEK